MTIRFSLRGRRRRIAAVCAFACTVAVPQAAAYTFDLKGFQGSFTNTVTIGASMRMEDRDPGLIGKSNLNPGLCVGRDSMGDLQGDTCNSSTDPSLNEAYVDAPGAFSVNGDDGNLNYDKYDIVSGAGKLLSELSLRKGGWNLFVRTLGFFDEANYDFDEYHPDTTFQPRHTPRPDGAEDAMARDFRILDAYLDGGFSVPWLGDRYLRLRVGDQVINWGESAFLLLNSINTLNPPDAPLLRLPGFQIAELLQPLGMATAQMSLTPNVSAEVFYNYEWEPVTVDPVGSFFSTADIAGATDNRYAMLSFGKAPEDPDAAYDPADNMDDSSGTFSSASRTVYFDEANEARDGGQFGLRLNYFAEWLNNGTEFSLYAMNYHSRFPLVSAYAADSTCINDATVSLSQALVDCGGPGSGDNGRLMLAGEPLPVDTVRLRFDYPEDIKLYGISWNTTIGNWSFNGEYAYRPNLPLQIQSVDLIFAALQPAFPTNNVGDPPPPADPAAVVPNRRAAVPDYIETLYRGNTVSPGDYIRGYERMEVGQFNMQFTRTIGGSNWLNADQVIVLLELGFQHIPDFPDLDEFQFNAPNVNTHISNGADDTDSITRDSATLNPGGANCTRACRQNPTAATGGFTDDFSWGFRFLMLPRYQSLFWNVNVEPLLALFGDVDGTSPGPGANFIEDRLQVLTGIRWDYLNAWSGELRYTMQTDMGSDEFHPSRDRDVLSFFVAYEF
ncbi:hypothetical protein PC39_08739 [Salinisphaera sp. PC39]|uniref:DUF1302 domain-containing protein n=1 Tax=Salinisphaera sp. PC39 TaxID=1304156 RepID=UPI00333EB2A8